MGRLLGAARGEAFGHVQRRMHLVRPMQWERIVKREATPAIKVEVEGALKIRLGAYSAARGRAFGHGQRRMHQVRPLQWERVAKREAKPA